MEIFGAAKRHSSKADTYDVSLHVYGDEPTCSFLIKKKEIYSLERVLIGIDGERLYIIKSSAANSLKVSHNKNSYIVVTRNKDLARAIGNRTGYYIAVWDGQIGAWYIRLKEERK